eukprot:8908752-Pyramimonas_sp.AAC.1
MIIDSDQPDGPEIVLTSLRAAQADTIFETIMATNRKCTVLALTIEGPETPKGPDPAELLTIANARWGARSAARLSHIAP